MPDPEILDWSVTLLMPDGTHRRNVRQVQAEVNALILSGTTDEVAAQQARLERLAVQAPEPPQWAIWLR